jgi:hypothetical protein
MARHNKSKEIRDKRLINGHAEQIPEITPEMIRAGAAMLLDTSDLMREMDRVTAEIYAEAVLRAAFRAGSTQKSEA